MQKNALASKNSKNATAALNDFSTMSQSKKDTFFVVQHAISEVTGLDLEDITIDADFEDDLGVSRVELLPVVNKIKLDLKDPVISHLSFDTFADCQIVGEMVELIDEERDL